LVAIPVIIGILSDTHDRDAAMSAGIDTLRRNNAEFFIHCGDIGSERCIDLLAGLPCAFVFGNTDWDRAKLSRYAASIEVPCYGNFANLELGGKQIAVIHGDDFRLKQRLIDEQNHDYILQGHTHIHDERRVGKTRLINPGALHRTASKTVATLDVTRDALWFHFVQV
jgi:putative phosphoesterase